VVRVSGGRGNKGERLRREEKRGSLYSESSIVRVEGRIGSLAYVGEKED
jgi:hypothetical protein